MPFRAVLDPAEPYRLFFPLGLLLGLVGIALWPLFQLHVVAIYPAVSHPRLMTQGFMAAFVFGFLGTAGPRLLSAPALTRAGIACLLALHAAAAICHLAGRHPAGDAIFLTELLVFCGMFVVRFGKREDLPPPAFALVPLGFLAGIAGTGLLLAGTPATYQLGSRLAFEGFFLLPMLGVGAFLFPGFLGLRIPPGFPDSSKPPPGWWRAFSHAAVCGVVILATYGMEVQGLARAAIFVRFAAALAFFLPQVPLWRSLNPSALRHPLRCGIFLMFGGLLLTALWPDRRVTMLHVVFIGGFGLTAMLVATRVMFGHSGFGAQLQDRAPFLVALAAFTHASIIARVAADFLPQIRLHLITAAALLWLVGAVAWSVRTIPKVFIQNSESATS